MSQKNSKSETSNTVAKSTNKTSASKTTKGKLNIKKLDNVTKLIIAGLVVIAIPFLVLAFILISASLDTGSILDGDRFDNDLDPAITNSQMNTLSDEISTHSDVEEVEVILKTATLRVYVDTVDSYNVEQVKTLSEEVYGTIMNEFNESIYFTRSNDKNMYDLEIHVYNLDENRDSEAFSYVITSKSSSNTEKVVDVVSEPKDPELAQQILDELEAKRNPQPEDDSSDLSVGGEDDGTIEGEGE